MAHVATTHHRHIGKTIGTGHCVPFVREVTGLPPTASWRRGDPVQGANPAPQPGTAIATFDPNGHYGNHTDGRSHAAIYLTTHTNGSIDVLDCWLKQPVHQRTIRNRNGAGDAVNDASRYYIIEVA